MEMPHVKVRSLNVVRTSRTLLCGLENNLFNSNGRASAINQLTARYSKKELSPDYEVRFIAYMMMNGSKKQKETLGAHVAKQHPGDCISMKT